MKQLTYLLSLALLVVLIACQATKLPKANVQKDPSPQLYYRYTSPKNEFSFDFPFYGHRFFKKLDTKALEMCKTLGIKRSDILFYESTYLSHHIRTIAVLEQNTEGVLERHFQRLKASKNVHFLNWVKNPIVKLDTNYLMTHNDYRILLDSNRASDHFNYTVYLEKNEFFAAEYYLPTPPQYRIRLVFFLNVDKSLLDETDHPMSVDWFYHSIKPNLSFLKQPIPPLDSTFYVPSPFNLASTAFKNNAVNPYLAATDTLLQKAYLYDSIRPELQNYYQQTLMTYYSFAGFNEEGFAARDSALGNSRRDSCPDNLFKGYQPTDAVKFIAEQAKNRRIVLLNEAHHAPICRIFALQILDNLYKNGFRYLALEALTPQTRIKQQGFPTTDDGVYTREPMYAEMMRHALRLGFTLVPYEAEGEECIPPPDAHRFFCHNQREQRQAENIMKVFKRDKKAKIVALVGHEHNYKNYLQAQRHRREGQKWAFLAMLLKKMSGFDPLSIRLVDMLERSLREYESPFFRCVWLTYAPTKPVVLKNEKTQASWKKPTFEDMVDTYVFHPRTSREIPYEWLQSVGYQPFVLDYKNLKQPFFFQIFYADELKKVGGKAVPAYNFPIRGESQFTIFLKPKTDFVVRFFTGKNELMEERPIKMP